MVDEWGTCVVVRRRSAVERKGSEKTRHEPPDLSVTVEQGLSRCSRLPGKIDNQIDVTREQVN